ncbi:TERF1-interacting nuclear factor 2 isoform X6 [Emydura macquarii macquarii]|uniref:TERF1-interacting nuclear factor 2 isoform X6 n=1 Tax=Emydura macquarii macquarii TaxID=1129001 RepID=UPI00352A1AAD
MAGSDAGQSGAPGPAGQDPCTALRLVAAAAWRTVRARRSRDFPRVLGLLEAVGRAAPDTVRFRHAARLRLGLQAAVVMALVREQQPAGKIFDALDTYFPEGERQRPPLAEQLEAEYGEPFLVGLEGLFYEYLGRLESTLPPPQLQELQEAAWSECPTAGPPRCPPALSVLDQYLTDMGHSQHEGLPAQPLGAEQPVPRTPGSRQRRSRQGAAPVQEKSPPALGLHSQPPGEQDLARSGDVVWESDAEDSSSPLWKASYQRTQHDTLIPTFHDHLEAPGGCPGCCAPGTPPPHPL